VMVNSPDGLVVVPRFVPLTVMDAPLSGAPTGSESLPLIVVWAKRASEKQRNATKGRAPFATLEMAVGEFLISKQLIDECDLVEK